MQYCGEEDIHYVMNLVDNELSEPYSIFTYRYAKNSYVTSAATSQATSPCALFNTLCCPYHAYAFFPSLAVLVLAAPLRGPSLVLLCRYTPDVLTQMTAPCRYFLHSWPRLCWLAFHGQQCFGVVVCKQDDHKGMLRGYIAMLVVKPAYRGLGVGKRGPLHRLPECITPCSWQPLVVP